MNRKNLMIAGVLIGGIIILSAIGVFIFNTTTDSTNLNNPTFAQPNAVFNAKSPQEKAIFIAKLNDGNFGFMSDTVENAYLTSDGKYWIVKLTEMGDYGGTFIVDSKTWMSKEDGGKWKPLDELIARYIAEIQVTCDGGVGEPQKITMDGKEIWKVPIFIYIYNENELQPQKQFECVI